MLVSMGQVLLLLAVFSSGESQDSLGERERERERGVNARFGQ